MEYDILVLILPISRKQINLSCMNIALHKIYWFIHLKSGIHLFPRKQAKYIMVKTRRNLSSLLHYCPSLVESWIGGLDLFPRDCQLSVSDTQAANLHFAWGLYSSERLFSGFLRNSVSRLPVSVAIFIFLLRERCITSREEFERFA